MKRLNALVLFVLISCAGYGQNNFIIENIKVFDGEAIITSTSVKVENGVIVEVAKKIKGSAETLIIKGKGKTLMPALSNAHVHAWSPQSLMEAAKAGVLNVMDMHGMEPYQGMMQQLKDSTNYARYYIAGYAATAPEGHGTQFGFPVPTLNKPEEAAKFISDRVKANVDHIKIIVEPWKTTLDSTTVEALIKEAHKARKIAVVHVSRLEDAIAVISNNADGLVHIWWDKEIKSSKLKELSESKSFFVIPTLLTTLKAFENMGSGADKFLTKVQLFAEVKKMYNAGVPILAGTDPPNFGINQGTDLYKELDLLYESGLPLLEVLKAGTSNISKAFSLEKSGYIKPGYNADFILIDGDVTQDLKVLNNSKVIWKNGKQVKL
ncbi:amidohydrolase family protein [Winogradskyella sp. UBA3174]|uniref:amidohydrolase family protein n=1 Tax=Winogradskyella sp. UBA3174 TaxID=1947785 RepID=UPI0025F07775|nr:amidohydrolase family protein [Winogradskyella sp. UBA3174]|tara:strand:- start:78104 stop:79240 length:1137 start_codon:yes stop_codon:yes gene_type:complete